jgi:hypothetical protein
MPYIEFRLQIRPSLDAFIDMGITIDNVHRNTLLLANHSSDIKIS